MSVCEHETLKAQSRRLQKNTSLKLALAFSRGTAERSRGLLKAKRNPRPIVGVLSDT